MSSLLIRLELVCRNVGGRIIQGRLLKFSDSKNQFSCFFPELIEGIIIPTDKVWILQKSINSLNAHASAICTGRRVEKVFQNRKERMKEKGLPGSFFSHPLDAISRQIHQRKKGFFQGREDFYIALQFIEMDKRRGGDLLGK